VGDWTLKLLMARLDGPNAAPVSGSQAQNAMAKTGLTSMDQYIAALPDAFQRESLTEWKPCSGHSGYCHPPNTVTDSSEIASNKCGSLRFGEATLQKEAGNCMRQATRRLGNLANTSASSLTPGLLRNGLPERDQATLVEFFVGHRDRSISLSHR
jgi:hypothetical protein